VVVEELLFERIDFGGIAFIEQDAEIAFKREDEELVRLDIVPRDCRACRRRCRRARLPCRDSKD
jgi:hypothetical protein